MSNNSENFNNIDKNKNNKNKNNKNINNNKDMDNHEGTPMYSSSDTSNKDAVMKVILKDETTIDDCIKNLNILSELNENDKLSWDENNLLYIDKNGFGQALKRSWYKIDRKGTLERIEKLIKKTSILLDKIMIESNHSLKNNNQKMLNENSIHLIQRALRSLSNSIKGIDNLKTTYRYDTTTKVTLESIIERIKIKIDSVNNYLLSTT